MNHALGPTSIVDVVLAVAALFVVVWAFYLAVRHTIRPGETSPDHIKRRVLDDSDECAS